MAVRPPAGRRADRRCCWKEERIQGKRLDGFRNGEKEKKNLQSSRVHFVSRGHGGWVQKVSGFQVKMDRNFARFNTLRGSRSYSSPCLSLSVCRSPRPRARRVRGAAGWSNSSYSFCRRPVVPPNSLSLSLFPSQQPFLQQSDGARVDRSDYQSFPTLSIVLRLLLLLLFTFIASEHRRRFGFRTRKANSPFSILRRPSGGRAPFPISAASFRL